MKIGLLFTLLLCLMHTSGSHYSNELLIKSSGLFYEKIGQARVSRANLTLVIHLNISHLEEARISLTRQYDNIRQLCQRFAREYSRNANLGYRCQETMQSLSQNINHMKELKFKQFAEIMKVDSRSKIHREVFNGVSHAYRWLHGKADEDEPHYHSDILRMLMGDSKKPPRGSQVLLIPTTTNICSTIFRLSNFSMEKFPEVSSTNATFMSHFYESTNSTGQTLFLDSMLPDYLSLSQHVGRRIDCEYTTYYRAVKEVKQQRSLKKTLGYGILLQELRKYDGEYELPLELGSAQPHEIYQYLYMPWQMIAIESSVVLIMKLPLLEPRTYDLYNTYPLPIQREQTALFTYILPEEEYFLFSTDDTRHSSLSTLSKCSEYSPNQYICSNLKSAKIMEEPICEALLMSPKVSKIPKNCDIRTISAESEAWKYVSNNQWIYVLQRPTSLTIICEEENNSTEVNNINYHTEIVVLRGTGIIKLDEHCRGRTGLYYLEQLECPVDANVTFYVPTPSVIEDIEVNHSDDDYSEIQLQPVDLLNVDLNDLELVVEKTLGPNWSGSSHTRRPSITHHRSTEQIVLVVLFSILLSIILSVLYYRYRSYSNEYEYLPGGGEVLYTVSSTS